MVYLIADTEKRWCKIGYSATPKKRISGIQTASPLKIEIISIIAGDTTDEKELHKKFKDKRLNGEWFKYDEEIINYIREQPQKSINDEEYTECAYVENNKPITEKEIETVLEIIKNKYKEGEAVKVDTTAIQISEVINISAKRVKEILIELTCRGYMYVLKWDVYVLGRFSNREQHSSWIECVVKPHEEAKKKKLVAKLKKKSCTRE